VSLLQCPVLAAMVDLDIDRRIAEAAAAVASLRQESSLLDRELQERRQRAREHVAAVAKEDAETLARAAAAAASTGVARKPQDMSVEFPRTAARAVNGRSVKDLIAQLGLPSGLEEPLADDADSHRRGLEDLHTDDDARAAARVQDSGASCQTVSEDVQRPGSGVANVGPIPVVDRLSGVSRGDQLAASPLPAPRSVRTPSPRLASLRCFDAAEETSPNPSPMLASRAGEFATLGTASSSASSVKDVSSPCHSALPTPKAAGVSPGPLGVELAMQRHNDVASTTASGSTEISRPGSATRMGGCSGTADSRPGSATRTGSCSGMAEPTPAPQAPARPPRPARPARQPAAPRPEPWASFSDEAVAGMSRRDRIALLERGGGGGVGGDEPSAVASLYEVGADSVAGPPPRITRQQSAERSRPSAAQHPSDEALTHMSRRERIAMLEQSGGGFSSGDIGGGSGGSMGRRDRKAVPERMEGIADPGPAVAPSRSIARPREEVGRHRASSESRPHASARAASLGDAPEPEREEDRLDDDAWLEERRQNRRLRLQQHGAGRQMPRGASASPAAPGALGRDGGGGSGGSGATTRGGTTPRSARLGAAGAAMLTSTSGFLHASAEWAPSTADGATERAGGAASSRATVGGRSPLEDLEDLGRLDTTSPEWTAACTRLAVSAHRLQSGCLVRAMELLLRADSRLSGDSAAVALRSAAESILNCLTAQLGNLGAAVVTLTLRFMAVARVEEQTYLDMLLARLLVLLRHERASFSEPLLAAIACALGTLHEQGVSAKRAASGASAAANRRCMENLGEQLVAALDSMGEEEIARVGGPFVVAFLDDAQRRALLQRAAALRVGLQDPNLGTRPLLRAMQDLELAVRRHSFAFIASLPDQTKDYLMKLKVATDQATPGNAAK